MAMKVRNTANSGVATAGSRDSASRAPAYALPSGSGTAVTVIGNAAQAPVFARG